MDVLKAVIKNVADIVEAIGVITIFLGILYSFYIFAFSRDKKLKFNYLKLRQSLGKSILIGLEILIAADIMATVVIDPTMISVLILAVIVIIRTVMSLSLEVELEGRFPWQKRITEN